MEVERRSFYQPVEILAAAKEKVEKSRELGQTIDYLTFVPDGEPTLDINLGQEIEVLKRLGIRIAVISNASLIWDKKVRDDLSKADWVSLKVDAVKEMAWRRINRPHRVLKLQDILQGTLSFSRNYKGVLTTETMLVRDVNDDKGALETTADFLAQVHPAKAYISVPTRPPAEEWASPPQEESLNRAYQILNTRLERVELLVGYEGDVFDFTGDMERDLLSIMAVHPMREEAVKKFLEHAGSGWEIIQSMIDAGLLIETEYDGKKFYLRRPELPSL
jgi:wyosine [tRNA(Phe)-imidazoG37] synthetase (radical SAM superfamily)